MSIAEGVSSGAVLICERSMYILFCLQLSQELYSKPQQWRGSGWNAALGGSAKKAALWIW